MSMWQHVIYLHTHLTKCHFSYFVFPKQWQSPWATRCPGSTGTHGLNSAPVTPKAAGTAKTEWHNRDVQAALLDLVVQVFQATFMQIETRILKNTLTKISSNFSACENLWRRPQTRHVRAWKKPNSVKLFMHLKVSLRSDPVLDFTPQLSTITSQTLKHHDGLELKTPCASIILILCKWKWTYYKYSIYLYYNKLLLCRSNTFIPLSCCLIIFSSWDLNISYD